MGMAKVKAAELSGMALVRAYVMALGFAPMPTGAGRIGYRSDHGSIVEPQITDAAAGELIAEAWISVERPFGGSSAPIFRCVTDYKGRKKAFQYLGVVSATSASLGEAVFRCFVASRLGEEFHMPDEM
jgi:hypothetical protein